MDDPRLARECDVFTRHLTGIAATPYVITAYAAAHAARPAIFVPSSAFGTFTVRLARTTPFFARASDAWCRLFAGQGVLRRKLVLLLAILETAPPFHREFDAIRGGRLVQAVALAASAAVWLIALACGALVLVPARLVLGADGTA